MLPLPIFKETARELGYWKMAVESVFQPHRITKVGNNSWSCSAQQISSRELGEQNWQPSEQYQACMLLVLHTGEGMNSQPRLRVAPGCSWLESPFGEIESGLKWLLPLLSSHCGQCPHHHPSRRARDNSGRCVV